MIRTTRFALAKSLLRAFSCLALAAATVPAAMGESPQFQMLHSFAPDEGYSQGELLLASDGNFYASTWAGVTRITPAGETTVLARFSSYGLKAPYGGLVETADGMLYGTTFIGGANNFGAIFKVSRQGDFKVVHSFSGKHGEGVWPMATLVATPDGTLYGTTSGGGPNADGTVFRLAPDGTLTTIRDSFGVLSQPMGMTLGADGNLYGVASANAKKVDGCSNASGGCGGFFRMSTDGTQFQEVAFRDREGWLPWSAPLIGSDGNLYGTSLTGVTFGGTVWRYIPGQGLQLLHEFHGPGGASPRGRLIQASDGNLYGTAEFGGANGGTVFRMTPDGKFTTLHRFTAAQGTDPWPGLTEGPEGVYGLTIAGGGSNLGTFFRISARAPAHDAEE